MGDGMLVEFPSVVDAVRCAVEIQEAMVERERDVPDERGIRYRVGINLGDIVIEATTRFLSSTQDAFDGLGPEFRS